MAVRDPLLVEVSLALDPVIEAYKKDIDRTLLRENLKLTPEQRLQKLQAFVDFLSGLRDAPRRQR
jgi:hypothetical protein